MQRAMSLQNFLSILLAFLFAQGCATITQGSMQHITVTSIPAGADLVVNGFQRLRTPAVVELSRKDSHQLTISLEGYHPETIDIVKVGSNMVAGNFLAGGLIGLAVDYSSGAAYRLVPEVVQVTLRPLEADTPMGPVAADTSDIQVEQIKADF
jgi:hypothetical protein